MRGFAPFSPEELKEAKEAWRVKDLKEMLTGNFEDDIEIIKSYNQLRKEMEED